MDRRLLARQLPRCAGGWLGVVARRLLASRVRGGSWSAGSWALRAGGRDADRINYRESDLGFRVARAFTP